MGYGLLEGGVPVVKSTPIAQPPRFFPRRAIEGVTKVAKISFGVIVTNARGKVGGGVFTKSRSGDVLRRRVVPSNPQTGPQTAVRSYLSDISAEWRQLTQAQRDA